MGFFPQKLSDFRRKKNRDSAKFFKKSEKNLLIHFKSRRKVFNLSNNLIISVKVFSTLITVSLTTLVIPGPLCTIFPRRYLCCSISPSNLYIEVIPKSAFIFKFPWCWNFMFCKNTGSSFLIWASFEDFLPLVNIPVTVSCVSILMVQKYHKVWLRLIYVVIQTDISPKPPGCFLPTVSQPNAFHLFRTFDQKITISLLALEP